MFSNNFFASYLSVKGEVVQSPVLQQHHNFRDSCVSNWQVPEANSIATGSVAIVLLSFTGRCLQILTKYCSTGKCCAQELGLQLGSLAEGSSFNYFVSTAHIPHHLLVL